METTAERTDIWSVTPEEDTAARLWWERTTEADKKATGARYISSRRDLRWGAMSCTENRHIALELINAGVFSDGQDIMPRLLPDGSLTTEERENFREFAATLPTIDECAFSADHIALYHGGEVEGEVTCMFVRGGWGYGGTGSSTAAAYGRMIQQIVEREA